MNICWGADEVYGVDEPEWLRFRYSSGLLRCDGSTTSMRPTVSPLPRVSTTNSRLKAMVRILMDRAVSHHGPAITQCPPSE